LIVEDSWLNQMDDVIVGHGISLLRWRSGGVKHPHDMPPSRFPPSPILGDSSAANSPPRYPDFVLATVSTSIPQAVAACRLIEVNLCHGAAIGQRASGESDDCSHEWLPVLQTKVVAPTDCNESHNQNEFRLRSLCLAIQVSWH